MKATNIQWDIDMDEVYELLDNMTYTDAADSLGIPHDKYANMTTSERHDFAYDLFHHSPGTLDEFMGLPNEIEIPEELNKPDDDYYNEDISDWLSDTYGFCHNGFEIED